MCNFGAAYLNWVFFMLENMWAFTCTNNIFNFWLTNLMFTLILKIQFGAYCSAIFGTI